ncbi:ATP synthase F1 subunit delta [Bartonella sp. CB175]|uniref:ATP synthase F1 subunit delta n=1 Tax=Bartonella sp. CB175 TaxID=3112256 RepID=UPI00300E564B
MSDSFSLIPLPLVYQRYAQALFDFVQEAGSVGNVEKAIASFLAMLDQNEDLKRFVQNPFSSVKEQVGVIRSVCKSFGFADKDAGRIVCDFLCVIAANRRLCALSGILHAFQRRVAFSRREISAQIISARALSSDQEEELRVTLEGVVGGKVLLCISVDPTILGGLIVRLGSFQIDTSLVAQLSSLKLALKKEVS